jgi:hypothetical protein
MPEDKKMTTLSGSLAPVGSAKIYAFPLRGRFAQVNEHDAVESAGVKPAHSIKIASGSGWYHEAAIEDASRTDWSEK